MKIYWSTKSASAIIIVATSKKEYNVIATLQEKKLPARLEVPISSDSNFDVVDSINLLVIQTVNIKI